MDSKNYYPKEVWKLAINISLCSFIQCFNLVSMNSCTENIAETLEWGDSPVFLSIFTTLYPFGAMIGSAFGSRVSSKIGIRHTIIYCNAVLIFASLIGIIPTNFTFGACRFVTGFIGAIFMSVPPVFINEITPDPMTGPVGTLVQQACSTGFLVSYLFGLLVPTENLSNNSLNYIWMLILVFPAFISIYQIYYFTRVFKYENPRWLIKNRSEEEAKNALRIIYKEGFVELGIKRLNNSSSANDQEIALVSENPSFRDMFCKRKYRKMVRNSLALSIGQQTAGVGTVLMYSTSMFEEMGGGKFFARGMTVVNGLIGLIAGLLAIPLLTKVGRKTILVFGTLGSSICLLCLGFFVGIVDGGVGLNCTLIFLYIFIFTISLGATFWTYIGEVCTDKAVSIGVTSTFITINVLSFCFPIALFNFGISACFFTLAGLAFILLAYVMIDLIETKGLTKQEIDAKIYS